MQSERRFKIDKYLEMARITKVEYKREHFLEKAELYLETEDQSPETAKNSVLEFAEFCGRNYFHHRSIAETYDDYIKFAKTNGFQPTTKHMMSKDLKDYFQLSTTKKIVGSVNARVYTIKN